MLKVYSSIPLIIFIFLPEQNKSLPTPSYLRSCLRSFSFYTCLMIIFLFQAGLSERYRYTCTWGPPFLKRTCCQRTSSQSHKTCQSKETMRILENLFILLKENQVVFSQDPPNHSVFFKSHSQSSSYLEFNRYYLPIRPPNYLVSPDLQRDTHRRVQPRRVHLDHVWWGWCLHCIRRGYYVTIAGDCSSYATLSGYAWFYRYCVRWRVYAGSDLRYYQQSFNYILRDLLPGLISRAILRTNLNATTVAIVIPTVLSAIRTSTSDALSMSNAPMPLPPMKSNPRLTTVHNLTRLHDLSDNSLLYIFVFMYHYEFHQVSPANLNTNLYRRLFIFNFSANKTSSLTSNLSYATKQ